MATAVVRGRCTGGSGPVRRAWYLWLVAALWFAWPVCPVAAQLISPGPLSRAHHELDGDEHCSSCHASGRRIDRNECLDCHKDLRRSVRARRGLHGREWRGKDCGQCHVEHLGRGTRLIRWPKDGPADFDHSRTGYKLRGAHRDTKCRDCHDKKNHWGSPTFLKLERACASCHEDPHKGRFSNDCQSCHNETRWESVDLDEFDHSLARFALRGRHKRVECVECHKDPPTYAPLKFQTCASCHQDPHDGRLGKQCKSCHTEAGWKRVGKVRKQHRWLSLANGHEDVSCRSCHDRGLDRPPRRGGACVSCHKPVHEAPFGKKCATCHRNVRWMGLPKAFSRSVHDRTPFPLNGAHETTDCAKCHNPRHPPDKRFRQLEFERCRDCHDDPHRGRWRASTIASQDCNYCHAETGFLPTEFGPTQHRSAAFGLEGKHLAVPCGACHEGKRPKLTWAHSPPQSQCADCHENPHGNQFAREMREGGCASCHTELGWSAPRIDHSIWPLTGAHEQVGCDACHTPSAEDKKLGRGASYRGVPRECLGCHGEAHAAQFRLSSPERACNFCHETVSFRLPNFDHASIADYPLEGRHGDLQCGECHPTVQLDDWGPVVRYRLGYRECAQCHADPHWELQ